MTLWELCEIRDPCLVFEGVPEPALARNLLPRHRHAGASERYRLLDALEFLCRLFQRLPHSLPYLPNSKRHDVLGMYFPEHKGRRLSAPVRQMFGYCKAPREIRARNSRIVVEPPRVFIV